MISYLKGLTIEVQKVTNNKTLLILEVNQIGYEINIPHRALASFSLNQELQVFTHQQIKEDQTILYGFMTSAERDLFRQLITVSGVGANLALALLDSLSLAELVQAIVTGNIKTLSKTPGVGQKTAERLALELKTKLKQWRDVSLLTEASGNYTINPELQSEVEMTLLALGYTDSEISQALQTMSQDSQLNKNPMIEEWLRTAIAILG